MYWSDPFFETEVVRTYYASIILPNNLTNIFNIWILYVNNSYQNWENYKERFDHSWMILSGHWAHTTKYENIYALMDGFDSLRHDDTDKFDSVMASLMFRNNDSTVHQK